MVSRFFDVYLLLQLAKVSVRIVEILLILLLERVFRFTFYLASFVIPRALLDAATRLTLRCTAHAFRTLIAPIVPASWFPSWRRAAASTLSSSSSPSSSSSSPSSDRPEFYFNTVELCRSRGYPVEEHVVRTSDGFMLALHRIPGSPYGEDGLSEEAAEVAASTPPLPEESADTPRPVVFIMHGFLQSSEAWVCLPQNLPFMLADAGFDVWLGNARGNKYSTKHTRLSPHGEEYWAFGLDEMAQIDVPATIDFITELTGVETLSYVGFSQGTAIGFACFSTNQRIAAKVNYFAALAPATFVKGFSNSLIDALTRSSPDLVYLIFGRKRLLPSTLFWQGIMGRSLYTRTIDFFVRFLFGWNMQNVREEDKPQAYAHIYSFSSVKCVVQWFQIMQSGRFQMYDDHRWRTQESGAFLQPRYPLQQIKTPMAIFFGGRDFLPDTQRLIEALPKGVYTYEEPSYEHMDFMYAASARQRTYSKIVAMCRVAATHGLRQPDGLHDSVIRRYLPFLTDRELSKGDPDLGDDDVGADTHHSNGTHLLDESKHLETDVGPATELRRRIVTAL